MGEIWVEFDVRSLLNKLSQRSKERHSNEANCGGSSTEIPGSLTRGEKSILLRGDNVRQIIHELSPVMVLLVGGEVRRLVATTLTLASIPQLST